MKKARIILVDKCVLFSGAVEGLVANEVSVVARTVCLHTEGRAPAIHVWVHTRSVVRKHKVPRKRKTPRNSVLWCSRRDLNPYGHPLEPKSSASANFATTAFICIDNYSIIPKKVKSIAYFKKIFRNFVKIVAFF